MKLNNSREHLLLLSSKFLKMLTLQESAHLISVSQRSCSCCELALDALNCTVLHIGWVLLLMSSCLNFGGSALTEHF